MSKEFVPYFHALDPIIQEDGSLGIDLQESVLNKTNTPLENKQVNQLGEPMPPKKFIRGADHHWMEKRDCDGHIWGLVVLQWNPGAKRWSHSSYVGTGFYVDTKYWLYHSHCPIPEF